MGRCSHTWAESQKLVKNCINIYISVELLWNHFQTKSRGGLETALESGWESVLTRSHTSEAKQIYVKVISKPVCHSSVNRAYDYALLLLCITN